MKLFTRLASARAAALALVARPFAAGKPLELGTKAPRLTGLNQHGHQVDLGALYDAGLVLVFVFPRAGSPHCAAQACSLRDSFEALQDADVTVVGVSSDSVERQAHFATNSQLPFILIADKDKEIIDGFGVPHLLSLSARQSFLIEDGVVVWRDLHASITKQAEDVLTWLDERRE